jgi:hypothetical protein
MIWRSVSIVRAVWLRPGAISSNNESEALCWIKIRLLASETGVSVS